MKRTNHTLSFIARPKKNGLLSIYLKYNYGRAEQKLVKADLTIPEAAWDKKKKEVKSRADYQQYRSQFKKLAERRQELLDKLNTHEIGIIEAIQQIPLWNINDSEKTLEFYFENEYLKEKTKGFDSKGRYYTIFRQLEKALTKAKRPDLLPIKLYHFHTHKSEIVNALLENQKKNTAIEYLNKLNTLLKEYDASKYPDKYFTKNMSRDVVKQKRGVDTRTLLEAIPKINTYKRLEAYLFWLYSFCLRGLDGQDVTLVEDSLLVGNVTLNDFLFEEENYDEREHIELSRKKTSAFEFTITVNAYPTLSILYLLKHVIAINRPKEVNEEDGLKLFTWDVQTNSRKWDLYSDFLQGRLQDLIGKSFKSTRHTFASTADTIQVGVSDQTTLLGNKAKTGSIANYSKTDELRLDIQHLAVLDHYQIIRIYITLLKHIKASPELDIEPVRDIDKRVFKLQISKHLKEKWRTVVDRLIEVPPPLDFDLENDVYRGVLR
tara:strand:- start:1284 stop:2756 length:1473 start_codon:yes stop_codon:yes gene_type:complete